MSVFQNVQKNATKQNNGNQQKAQKQETLQSMLGAKYEAFTNTVSVYLPIDGTNETMGTLLAIALETTFHGEVFCENKSQLMHDKNNRAYWQEIVSVSVHFNDKTWTIENVKQLRFMVQLHAALCGVSSLITVVNGSMFLVQA
jgi:hypothetical protein